MATITTKSLGQLLLSWISAAQAACSQVLDFSTGSVNLAIAEAGSAITLWLQRLALIVLGQSRFATSYGADADSWGAQFSYERLGAVAATVTLSFFRANTTQSTSIPVGQEVQTNDSSQTFQVYVDTTNSAYSNSVTIGPQGGYLLPAGTVSVSVPAIDTVPGSAGNVQAGTVTLIVDSIDNVDGVTNPAAAQGGLNAESDPAYKARFPLWLAGLARANLTAIEAAIASTQQGLQYIVVENQIVFGSAYQFYDRFTFFDEPGNAAYPSLMPWPGIFFAIVDDGSGHPPQALLTSVAQNINAVRALTIEYNVFGPTVVPANIICTMTVLTGYTKSTLVGLATVALQNWLNSQPLGTTVIPVTRIAQVVYDTVAGVSSIGAITINGSSADLMLNIAQVVKAGTIEIN